MKDALSRLRLSIKTGNLYLAVSEVIKVMKELSKWRKFDKLMQKEFDQYGLISSTTYMRAQLQLGLIGEKAKRDRT